MPKPGIVRRVTFVALKAVMVILLVGNFITIANPSFASINMVERPEEDLLILELHINSHLRNAGFLVYLPYGFNESDALVPLRALSKELSVAIDVIPGEGRAEGWFGKEDNEFRLDLSQNMVVYNGSQQEIPEGIGEAHYGDIYVQAKYLEEWFDLNIEIDITTLRMFVTSGAPLPFEEKIEREKKAERMKFGGSEDRRSSPASLLPYKNFTLPSLVLQDSINIRHIQNDNIFHNAFSIQSHNDIAKLGTRFLLSGISTNTGGTQMQNAQLTFRRRDPGNNLLGPLNAGSIAFGDIDYPDVPLFSGRKRGAGVFIASNSHLAVSRSFGSEQTIITGDAPIGWDAELYRNGYFVDFQQVGDDGRYNFEDVELLNGFNLFKITLYGPEGQQTTETQRIVRGGKLLKEGEVDYEFAAGMPDADFLPITETRRTNRDFGASGQVFYGVKNYLTLGTSVFSGSDVNSTIEQNQTVGTTSAIFPLLGFRNQVRYMRGTEGRSGYELETTTRMLDTNMSLSHREYNGFDEDDRDLQSSTTLNLNRKIGRFSTSLEVDKSKFLDQEDELSLRKRISTRFMGIELSNSLLRILSDSKSQQQFEGEASVLTYLSDWRLRFSGQYDLKSDRSNTLQNLRLSTYKTFKNDSTLRLNATHNFLSELTSADLRYSQQFDKFSMDFNVGTDSEQNYFAGVTMRTALQPDFNGKYDIINASNGSLGSVGIRAYMDTNKNNQFDEGEAVVKGIEFRSNRGKIDGATDENGLLFVRGLGESSTRFSIDNKSLPSIYLKPIEDFWDVLPRVGASELFDVGFEKLGEVDGFVYKYERDKDGNSVGASGITVNLIDANSDEEISSVTSEYDGYYIFSAIPLGDYRIETEPVWSEDPEIMPRLDVRVDHDNNIVMDRNLSLPPMKGAWWGSESEFDGGVETEVETEVETGDSQEEEEDASTKVLDVEPAAGDKSADRTLPKYYVQVGSFYKKDQAQAEIERLAGLSLLGKPLDSFLIHEVLVKDRTYFRVVTAAEKYKKALVMCSLYMTEDIVKGCLVTQN